MLTSLFTSIISTSLAAVLIFLLRNWIVERLKFSIQHEYSVMLESYKSQIARRELAYEEIVNALYDKITYLRIKKDDFGQGTGLSQDQERDIYLTHMKASASLSRATDIGSLFISKAATDVLHELRNRISLDYDNEPQFEFYANEYKQHKEALSRLLSIAIDDLKRA